MAKDFQYAGSVSHGTMRPEDLIPAFLDTLEALDEETYVKFLRELVDDSIAYLEDEKPDELSNITNSLFDKLGELAPEGYYFGASEGDGADYGFWEDPDYEPIADNETQYETYDGDELV